MVACCRASCSLSARSSSSMCMGLSAEPVVPAYHVAAVGHKTSPWNWGQTERPVNKESFHADTSSLPWAERWAGDARIRLKLLMADIEGQRFAVRMQFAPGLTVAPHKHTGEVHAFTTAGK